jgi:hypothetical protein
MILPCGIAVYTVYLAYKALKKLIKRLLFSPLSPSLHASPFSLSSSLQRQSEPQEAALPILQAREGNYGIYSEFSFCEQIWLHSCDSYPRGEGGCIQTYIFYIKKKICDTVQARVEQGMSYLITLPTVYELVRCYVTLELFYCQFNNVPFVFFTHKNHGALLIHEDLVKSITELYPLLQAS